MKVEQRVKLDGEDARRLREMIESAPWKLFAGRVEAELARATSACERSAAPVEIHRAQGAAMALRAVMRLPAQILSEARSDD